ncbi:MAG: hypothetical protein H7239_15635 [Flavobacterium sp.]|nr:hypothetical protein [Flavobacterium sp.]
MNISKKWVIIGGVVIVLLIFGKYNEKNSTQKKTTTQVVNPVDTLNYAEKFDKKQFNEITGVYKPVRNYLKKTLNDPSSLEIANTWNNGMNKDSTFAVKTTFRAKNSFNATVLQAMYCNIDIDGNLSEIRIE